MAAPGLAQATTILADKPLPLAQGHCRLMLLSADPGRMLVPELMDLVFGKENYADKTDVHDRLRWLDATAGLPDFGFIVGARWQTATRMDRQRFNRAFAKLMLHRFFVIIPAKPELACTGEMKITLQPGSGKTFQATYTTTLPVMGGKSVPVVYRLEKTPPMVWEIQELTINTIPIRRDYEPRVNALIAQNGFEGTADMLSDEADYYQYE